MLDKLGGVFAPRPSTGPHKLRECLPLVIILRNRLKYALTNSEVTKIVTLRTIKVDGKVRTDATYPAGFMGELIYRILPSLSADSKPVCANWCTVIGQNQSPERKVLIRSQAGPLLMSVCITQSTDTESLSSQT